MTITLGPRLKTVASLVPAGARLGDIGTDHAYLPIALIEARQIAGAVGVDVHEGPYRSAQSAVESRNLSSLIDVRFGDGLLPLTAGEVDTLTLAGMGGKTMLEIFAARPDVLGFVTDLIVQPQGAEGAVRLSLLGDGWRLKSECLVKEDDRIYTVMAFSRHEGHDLQDLASRGELWTERLTETRISQASGTNPGQSQEDTRSDPVREKAGVIKRLVWNFGPLILEERNDLLQEYLADYSGMLQRRLGQMKRSEKAETLARIKEISEELNLVEGMRTWQ